MNPSFWIGFEKRAEILTERSESSTGGGTTDEVNAELESTKHDPRLAELTVDGDRGPKGGMA